MLLRKGWGALCYPAQESSDKIKRKREAQKRNRIPKCDVTKNKFVKLWDLVPFSSKASLEKGSLPKITS